MIEVGEVVSYWDMCREEETQLQRGMYYRLHGEFSVILMSVRPGAPYNDRIEEDGRVLIYEGHDLGRRDGGPHPKETDQPKINPNGRLTQNGLFYEAALKCKQGEAEPELVRVYEKIRSGIWVYNGVFKLVDAWKETSNSREVFKFRLEIADHFLGQDRTQKDIDHTRMIPPAVKLEVWKRDNGQCVLCGSKDNLHFDHIIPYSKGGSSLVADNVQLLCARHNIAKRDKIE